MMRSLRRRLLIGTALGALLVMVFAGSALYATMKASLLSEFDQALQNKADTLAGLIEQEGRNIDLEFSEADMVEFRDAQRPQYYQVWRADGAVVARSPSLQGRDLPKHALDADRAESIVLPDGRPGRMALRRFIARRDDESSPSDSPVPLVLALARDVLDVEAALTRLRRFMIIIGAVAPLVLVGILSRLVSIGLKPVDALAGQIGAIDEQRLSTTIEPAGAPTELRPVVVRLNEMLSRLARAFEREKTLTADVAHELRTPLAGLRSTLEVALSRQREPAAYQQAMSESLAICRQTQTLVENLLALARLDVGADRVRHQPAPIDSLLDDAWKPFSQEASSKALKVQWDVEPGLVAHTDPDKLRLVLNNLLENAVHYVDPGGSVAVRASRDNGTTRLRISNSGSRVSPDQVAHVFDRFWRGDVARQSDGVHTGLGLALCKRIVEQLGGQISADSTKNGEFSVNVTFDAGARQQ